jgi:hypothetical protein
MSKRDAIRSKTVGSAKIFKKEIVTVDGEQIEVRQLSVGDRKKVLARSSKNGEVDPLDFQIWAIISTCYVPETEEKLFEDTDYNVLSEQPTGGFVDELSKVAVSMLSMEGKPTNASNETTT